MLPHGEASELIKALKSGAELTKCIDNSLCLAVNIEPFSLDNNFCVTVFNYGEWSLIRTMQPPKVSPTLSHFVAEVHLLEKTASNIYYNYALQVKAVGRMLDAGYTHEVATQLDTLNRELDDLYVAFDQKRSELMFDARMLDSEEITKYWEEVASNRDRAIMEAKEKHDYISIEKAWGKKTYVAFDDSLVTPIEFDEDPMNLPILSSSYDPRNIYPTPARLPE